MSFLVDPIISEIFTNCDQILCKFFLTVFVENHGYKKVVKFVGIIYSYFLLKTLHSEIRANEATEKHWLSPINFIPDKKSCHQTKQPSRVVLNICSKFIEEHPCQSAISIKLLCNFIEIALCRGCSLHILRTPFPKNTSGGLLLTRVTASTRS